MTDDKCGAKGIETPNWDPYHTSGDCPRHDAEFEKVLEGVEHKSAWVTARDFIGGSTKTMLKGMYAVAVYPIYILIGGVGGFFRMLYLERKENKR